ncbi:MAG TPA: TetR/AcrR family transcriptional regulator [Bacteroidota bacterium]|nr:TetR/AcrR family transcriptional regulator [Bacteroidota bacterium]
MRRSILDSAMKLFLEEGFENVSIRKIADKIEYSPATIYLYFRDKDEILYALHVEGFEELFRRQQAVRNIPDPRQRLRRHGEIYVKFALDNPEYYNLMFIMRSPLKKVPEAGEWQVGTRSYDFFKSEVEAAMNAGVLRKMDPQEATFGLWSFAHGIVALILRNRCPMLDHQNLTAAALKVFNTIMENVEIQKA